MDFAFTKLLTGEWIKPVIQIDKHVGKKLLSFKDLSKYSVCSGRFIAGELDIPSGPCEREEKSSSALLPGRTRKQSGVNGC